MKFVRIFIFVGICLAGAGLIASLVYAQYQFALCYGLIVTGLALFLYNTRKRR